MTEKDQTTRSTQPTVIVTTNSDGDNDARAQKTIEERLSEAEQIANSRPAGPVLQAIALTALAMAVATAVAFLPSIVIAWVLVATGVSYYLFVRRQRFNEHATSTADRPSPVERAKERYVEGDLSEAELEVKLEQYEDDLMADIELEGEK